MIKDYRHQEGYRNLKLPLYWHQTLYVVVGEQYPGAISWGNITPLFEGWRTARRILWPFVTITCSWYLLGPGAALDMRPGISDRPYIHTLSIFDIYTILHRLKTYMPPYAITGLAGHILHAIMYVCYTDYQNIYAKSGTWGLFRAFLCRPFHTFCRPFADLVQTFYPLYQCVVCLCIPFAKNSVGN